MELVESTEETRLIYPSQLYAEFHTISHFDTIRTDHADLSTSLMITTSSNQQFPEYESRTKRFLRSLNRVPGYAAQSIHEIIPPLEDDRHNSTLVAGWNVCNLIQGIGILGIPYSVKVGGWTAIYCNFLFSAMCCFTGLLIIDCLYEICPVSKQRVRVGHTYTCIGQRIWPRFGRQMVTFISTIEMFGALTLYIILLSQMASKLMGLVLINIDLYYLTIICTAATLPFLFVTKMSIISWFSVIGVTALMGTICVIIGFALTRLNDMLVENISAFDINSVPVCLGIIVFSYCAHAVFPNIEGSMKHPEQFPCMMKCAFSLAAILKAFLGLTCVLIFGMDTEQEITANMATSGYFSSTVSILVFVNVFFSIPLVTYVITERFDAVLLPKFSRKFHKGEKCNMVWIFLTRSILLCSSILTLILVPQFALLMSLIGSLTGTCLAFIFPCWFHIVIYWDQLSRWQIVLRIGVGVCGMIVGLLGTSYAIKDIIFTFS